MTLDRLGRLRWTPSATQLGNQFVTLTVTDSAGAKVTQQFNLSVTADTEAPKVNLIGSANYCGYWGRSVLPGACH
jgi:hypothetical protein